MLKKIFEKVNLLFDNNKYSSIDGVFLGLIKRDEDEDTAVVWAVVRVEQYEMPILFMLGNQDVYDYITMYCEIDKKYSFKYSNTFRGRGVIKTLVDVKELYDE